MTLGGVFRRAAVHCGEAALTARSFMTTEQIIVAAVAIMSGCFLQTMVGFGAGLFSIPIMVWAGVPLPSAITIMVVAGSSQILWGTWRFRREVQWKKILPVAAIRVMMYPVGIMLLYMIVGIGKDAVKEGVGWGLLLVLVLAGCFRVQPRQNVHAGWTVGASMISGILGGLIGMGGPPVVLWVMAHDWTSKQTRASIWGIVAVGLLPLLVLLRWRFGDQIEFAALVGLAVIPLVLLSSSIGFRLSENLSSKRLRQVIFVVLTLIALSLIISPLM